MVAIKSSGRDYNSRQRRRRWQVAGLVVFVLFDIALVLYALDVLSLQSGTGL